MFPISEEDVRRRQEEANWMMATPWVLFWIQNRVRIIFKKKKTILDCLNKL